MSVHMKVYYILSSFVLFYLDPKTSEWSFPLKYHDQLMISIKPLEPYVKIEKLPNFILKVNTYIIYLKYINSK